jgi:hypothetical protein
VTLASRANVVSSFTIIKGAMIEETYAVFVAWDFERTKRENLDRLRDENFISAKSQTWLRDVAKVLNRRFDPAGRDRPIVLLAKAGWSLDEWRPTLLWHITRDEFLLRDFLLHWVFPAFEAGAYRLRPEELYGYLRGVATRGGTTEHEWSEETLKRVSAGLLGMAVDFGILRGKQEKEFAPFHLSERSFLYLLYAMRDATPSPRKILDAADWRMFLMRPADVERELLRLHQFKKVGYEVAGSLIQLTLPYASSREFAERMVA